MSAYSKNYRDYSKLKRQHDPNPFRRSDSLPAKKISRDEVKASVDEYLRRGGKITLITEEDVFKRSLHSIVTGRADESYNFLNEDFGWN
jgi:hypothetical protein